MKLTKVLMSGLIISLASCASKPKTSLNLLSESVIQANSPLVPAPDIGIQPEKVFFPLRIDPSDNQIKPSFQSRVCVKKFVICVKWEKRTLFFSDLTWFYQNNFGLSKLPELK